VHESIATFRAKYRVELERLRESLAARWGEEIGPPETFSRSERRGHDVDFDDFLPCDQWHIDHGFTRAEVLTAIAEFLAYVRSAGACRERMRRGWGVRTDEPAPARPLDLLTPLRPNAPDALVLEEVAAA
jgi:hypothetical protein